MVGDVQGEGFVFRDLQEKETEEKNGRGKAGIPAMEINFSTFILSLGSSVMLNFGEIPDPLTGKKEKNLPMAKQTIDILSLLQEKTKGNLAKDEEKLIENLLADLKMQYVNLSRKQ
jgi:hypothetical protein